jgi:uncharacterized repeat protein (TIGR02543 family)
MKRLFLLLGLAVFLCLTSCSKDPVSPEKPVLYTVNVTATNGTVQLSPAGGSYSAGTIVTLTAVADTGYTFSGWSGDLTGTVNPAQISVTSNLTITALFTAKNTELPTDPESLTTINGIITSDTTWNSDITINGALDIQGNVVWSRKIKINVLQNAVINISSGGSLTIQEGVVVTLSTGAYIRSGYNSAATFVAAGTDSLPITFTKEATIQNWGYAGTAGILIYSNSTATTSLNYCIIEYATGGIYADGISPVITNCTIRNNAGYGIYFIGQAMPKDSASFIKNTITANGSYPISISSEGITRLSGDTHMEGNTTEGIEVRGGNVITSGTWRRHNQPYIFTRSTSTSIEAPAGVTITVNPGVICKFDNGNFIQVGYSSPGTFIVSGTDTLPVVFTRIEGIQNWGHGSGGILISSQATQNSAFNNCIIEYATSGLRIGNGSIVISNCRIRNNANYGVYFADGSGPKDTLSFIKDSITGNGGYPLSIHANEVVNLPGETFFSGNAKQLIEVRKGAVAKNGTWRKHMVPYFFNGAVNIGSEAGVTISVNPGTVLMFDQSAFLEIGYTQTASFIAHGTATDSIRFISGATAAYWGYDGTNGGGLWFGSKTAGNSSLQYCVIDSATAGIYVTDATLAISNCRITNNQQNGIVFYNASPKDSAGFLNNVITKNGAYGIKIPASKLGKLSGTGTVAGNALGGIFVEGNEVESSATWKKHDAPYIVKGTVAIGSEKGAPAVTIMPGAKFELLQEAYFEIGYSNAGALIANGTATDSIVFTSHNDGVFWGYSGDNAGGLWVGDGAATTTSFTYCIIEKATAGVYLDMAATVKNCTIRNNEGFGIVIADEGTDANVSDNVYSDNGSGDVSQYE